MLWLVKVTYQIPEGTCIRSYFSERFADIESIIYMGHKPESLIKIEVIPVPEDEGL